MVRPTSLGRALAIRQGQFGFDSSQSGTTDPVDLLLDADVQVASNDPEFEFVGATSATNTAAVASLTINVPTGVANGDILILAVDQDNSGTITISGWTQIGSNNLYTYFRRTASSEPSSYTVNLSSSRRGGLLMVALRNINVSGGVVTAFGFDASGTAPALTASSAPYVLVAGLECNTGDEVITAPAGYTLAASYNTTGTGGGYSSGALAYGFYTGANPPAAAFSTTPGIYSQNAAHIALTIYQGGWFDAPLATDGDDATYEVAAGSIDSYVIRVDMGTALSLASLAMKVGYSASGSQTFVLRGANESDLSDADSLASFTYTALGSYTPSDVTFYPLVNTAYRYYAIEGTAGFRLFTINAYGSSSATSALVQAQLSEHLVDATDAHDASAVSVLDVGGLLAATDVEAALAELAGYTVISPSQLTANTDNWNPTGLATADVIRVSTDASRNLTGMVAPSVMRTIILANIGAQDLVLKHDVTSTAANRFYCPNDTDLTLKKDSAVTIAYDLTSSRWRVMSIAAASGGVTYGTPALTLGTSNTAGSTDEAIRRDATILAFDATVPVTQASGDTAATGSAAVAARRDHKHGMPAIPSLSSSTPVQDGGAGSAGSGAAASKDDHKHPGDTVGIEFVIDGGGAAITTGAKGFLKVPFACTITESELESDVSTTATVTIKKRAYGGGAAASIVASALPTLTAATESKDSTLTGWTLSLSAGDKLYWEVTSNNNAKLLTSSLTVTRT